MSAPDQSPRSDGEAATVLRSAACVAVLAGYVYLVGWIVTRMRFAAAKLPGQAAAVVLDDKFVLGAGLRAIGFVVVMFALLCGLAYASTGRKWQVHAQAWQDIVREKGVRRARADGLRARSTASEADAGDRLLAARAVRRAEIRGRLHLKLPVTHPRPGRGRPQEVPVAPATEPDAGRPAPEQDRAVRLIAGFNVFVISAVIAVVPAREVESFLPQAWWAVLGAWALAFLIVRAALMHRSPVSWPAGAHAGVWLVLSVAAVLVSAPIGVLVLNGVAVATFGRKLARQPRPQSFSALLGSPVAWAVLAAVMLVGAAFYAQPPVSFPRAVVATPTGERLGGYVGRTSAGIYLATCTPLADATSTNERVVLVGSRDITGVAFGGASASLDSGERPSLAAVVLHTLGVDPHPPTLVRLDLRPRRATCAGALPPALTVGAEDPALGAGAIAGPAPPGGRAHDGDPPMEQNAPPAIARLARRYQPTVEVTVADRFWPVSVGAVLGDRGPAGEPTCLRAQGAGNRVCPARLSDLRPGRDPGEFLRYPAPLADNATAQFRAFEAGQYVAPGRLHQWLADPGRVDPWASAQVYFYYAGPAHFRGTHDLPSWPVRDSHVPDGLIGLQYWFFYPFNYYPTVVRSGLMNDAPLAGDVANTDLHQGDWEHATVLLDPTTLTPLWLYTAHHADEGRFVPWTNAALSFDGGHPIVQAAFGGHPTYDNNCAQYPRSEHNLHNLVSDWVVCGSGRFAFRASSTPLVDIARTGWACWRGHFGLATPTQVGHARQPESSVQRAIDSNYHVAGPRSPLWQAENGRLVRDGGPRDYGACATGTPVAAEDAALGDPGLRSALAVGSRP